MNIDLGDKKIQTDGDNFWIAPTAVVIGEVKLAKDASIWFNSVLRGDVEQITIGKESNFQDLSIGHADKGFPLIIGNRVTVGHRCITHGCEIDDDCLIGMGAILMNGVKINRGCIVGAGAIVLEGTNVPPFSMIAGSPAKVLKTYNEDILENIKNMSKHYATVAEKYRIQLVDV